MGFIKILVAEVFSSVNARRATGGTAREAVEKELKRARSEQKKH